MGPDSVCEDCQQPSKAKEKAPVAAPDSFEDDHGSSWHHARLQSAGPDAARIGLDFKTLQTMDDPNTEARGFDAAPLWLNVEKEGLSPSDQVEAVIVDHSKAEQWGAPTIEEKVTLDYAGDGRFTAQVPSLPIYNDNAAGSESNRQELTVTVNGEPLANPISDGSFKLNLSRVPGSDQA